MHKSLKKAFAFSIALSMVLSAAVPVFANKPTYITNDTYYCNNMNYKTGEAINEKTKSSHLKLITNYDTYIQEQSYTCGCVAAMTLENYYTGCGMDETKVYDMLNYMGSTEYYGTDTVSMKAYFDDMGWDTEVNYIDNDLNTWDESCNPKVDGDPDWSDPYWTEQNPYESLKFLKDNVDKNLPTIVEWIDWGGHWQVVIGYDDNGTSDFTKKTDIRDDVIIMADPADKTDHNWDGYYTVPAARFLYMWYDNYCLVRNPSSARYINPDYGVYDYLSNNYVKHPFLIATPPDAIAHIEGATGAAVTVKKDILKSSTGASISITLPRNTDTDRTFDSGNSNFTVYKVLDDTTLYNVDIKNFSLYSVMPDTEVKGGIYDIAADTKINSAIFDSAKNKITLNLSCSKDFDVDCAFKVIISKDVLLPKGKSTPDVDIMSNAIKVKQK